jgi:hypothetical protein
MNETLKVLPVLGQQLFSLNSNMLRQGGSNLIPVTVTNICGQYFTCEGEGFECDYYIDTWREKTEYCENSKLYTSINEWEGQVERKNLYGMTKIEMSDSQSGDGI